MRNDAQLFSSGSGVQADILAITLQAIGSGVAIAVFTWIVMHVFRAYGEGQIKSGEAIWAALKATVVLLFVLLVIFV